MSGRRPPLLAARAGGFARQAPFTGAPDTVRVLGLRIDFETDRLGSQTTTSDGRFDLRDGGSLGIVIDPPPHNRSFFLSHFEALRRYMEFSSYGNMVVEYDVYPLAENAAYRLGDTEDYGPWTLGQASFDEAARFFKDAVSVADRTDSIAFGAFDVIAVIHAGSDFQADLLGDSPRDFPTFTIGLIDSVLVNGGAVAITGGMVLPETESQDGFFAAMNGTIAHEFGHTAPLNLPDLYDIYTFFPAVGVWSNMDSGYILGTEITNLGIVVSGILPTSLDPWTKEVLWPGLIERVDPGRELTTTLEATQISNRFLRVPLGAQEYLLLENRQTDLNGDNTVYLERDSTTNVILGPGLSSDDPTDTVGDKEYDFLLPGQGVLAWHIDPSVICLPISNLEFSCGYNYNPDLGVNSNPDRLGVRLLEADGIRDIGNPNSFYFFGGPRDPYFVGNRTRMSDDTSPSIRTNDRARSHVEIEVLDPAQNQMGITVRSNWRVAGWPVGDRSRLITGAPTYGSLRREGRASFRHVVASAESLIYAWTAAGTPYYTGNADGVFAALPAPILGSVLLADSLFQVNADVARDAAVVATGMDGRVYAMRADTSAANASIPLAGWPPPLGDPLAPVRATTPPALAPTGSVLVGAEDGRVFAIVPSSLAALGPLVEPVADTLVVSGSPVTAPVTGNLAIGRFTGAGGYQIAFVLESGHVRALAPGPKDPGRLDAVWDLGGAAHDVAILGVDLDREPDGDLELIVLDRTRKLLHAYDLTGRELSGWPIALTHPISGRLASGDMDADGYPELFAVDDEGFGHRWTRNGVEPMGWPVSFTERFGIGAVGTTATPLLVDLTGDGAPEVLFTLWSGLLMAVARDGMPLPGWPAGTVTGVLPASGALVPLDPSPGPSLRTNLHLVVPAGDSTLAAVRFPAAADSSLASSDGVSYRNPWIGEGGNRQRTYVLDTVTLRPAAPPPQALAEESIYFFPNPTHGDEIGLAYRLGSQVGGVEIRILDPLGTEIFRLDGPGEPTDNVARIPVKNLASGVYMARLEVRRGGERQVAFRKFAVVR